MPPPDSGDAGCSEGTVATVDGSFEGFSPPQELIAMTSIAAASAMFRMNFVFMLCFPPLFGMLHQYRDWDYLVSLGENGVYEKGQLVV